MASPKEFADRSKKLGVEIKDIPSNRIVVISGFAQRTPLGDTEETWQGLLYGPSGVREFDVGNHHSKIAAPLPDSYNPWDNLSHINRKELKNTSFISAMATETAVEALMMAGALNDQRRLLEKLNRNRVGSFVSSGYANNEAIINVYKIIQERGSDRIAPQKHALPIFPEQLNADVTRFIGISGTGGNSVEACATGLSNPALAAFYIKYGLIDMAVAGGFENLLYRGDRPTPGHPDVSVGIFSSFGALSGRNDEPEKASRPHDKDRDGFILADGGGVVVMEEYQHALDRGAPIFAFVTGFDRSMDGYLQTELDPWRVGGTILKALYNPDTGGSYDPDAIVAHATATPLGDRKEPRGMHYALGDRLYDIPMTFPKSKLGHMAGGSGANTLITAIQALRDQKLPPIMNLDNPDIYDPDFPANEQLSPLRYVLNKPLDISIRHILAMAYGFGGYNAAVALKTP